LALSLTARGGIGVASALGQYLVVCGLLLGAILSRQRPGQADRKAVSRVAAGDHLVSGVMEVA